MKTITTLLGGSDSIVYEWMYVIPAQTLQIIEIGAFGDGTVVKSLKHISLDMFSDLLDSVKDATYLQFLEWLQKNEE